MMPAPQETCTPPSALTEGYEEEEEAAPLMPIISAEQLQALRLAAGLRGAELARRIGYTRGAWYLWERGTVPFPTAQVPQLLRVLEHAITERAEHEALQRRISANRRANRRRC